MEIKMWEVGGHVRDSLLGIESKDIDIAVEAPSWEVMREFVQKNTQKIFLEKPEFLTIRAMGFDGLPKDFVLCRKDGDYSDGRRPDSVEPGTILDDLQRRDFTVNAIARNVETGEIFDPFDGVKDIKSMYLRCVGDTKERFDEDALRILRAIRFHITKGFLLSDDISRVLCDSYYWPSKLAAISVERIREEMLKCFRHSTPVTLRFLGDIHPQMVSAIFGDDMWLKPTMEER